MKKILFCLYILLSILFLIYLIIPGPTSISQFNALPNSVKSTLSGDTYQIPNVAAYYSNNFRDVVIPFYLKNFKDVSIFFFPPFRLNYPPEFAFTAIKDQTQSTYLEEIYYPFRESLFVNGLEPFNPDGTQRWWGAAKFQEEGQINMTKVTLRLYSNPVWARVMMWVLINIAVVLLYKVTRKVLINA